MGISRSHRSRSPQRSLMYPRDRSPCCQLAAKTPVYRTEHVVGFVYRKWENTRCSVCGTVTGPEKSFLYAYDPILDKQYGKLPPYSEAAAGLENAIMSANSAGMDRDDMKAHLLEFVDEFIDFGIVYPRMAIPYRHGSHYEKLKQLTSPRVARKMITFLWRAARNPPQDGVPPRWKPPSPE